MRSQFAAGLQTISGSISVYIYAVLGESSDAKGNYVIACLSLI